MTNEQKASLDALLKRNNGTARISQAKATLRLTSKIGDVATELKAAGYKVSKWSGIWIFTGQIESEPPNNTEPEQITEPVPDEKQASNGLTSPFIISDSELKVAKAIKLTLETLAREGKAANGKTLDDLMIATLPEPKSREKVLKYLIDIKGDVREEIIEGQHVYRGRRWYTRGEIAKALKISLEDVHLVIHNPQIKARPRASNLMFLEYSAWPSVIKVVREALHKIRPKLKVAEA